jgi:hypothetical protein
MTDTTLPTPHDFLLSIPVYQEFIFIPDNVWKIIDFLYFGGTYDSYCTTCKRDSTFQVIAPERPPQYIRNLSREHLSKQQGMKPERPQIPSNVYRIEAKCTRQHSHIQYFLFLIDRRFVDQTTEKSSVETTIQKIGQHPSYGDLNLPRVKKYAAVLDKRQLGELNRAIGLASHDVGIGSYVYLRRVFEALIEEAHLENIAEAGWNEEAYNKTRMGEKIVLLRHHLPEFLVEHPEMYSLLSKGVHELSEEDCLTHFDTLRIGIELILDEKLERKGKEQKIRDAKAALSKAVDATTKE